MQKQSVLIVGAGAMGAVVGYHLRLSGTKAFAALYDSSGESTCSIINATLYDMLSVAFFPLMAVSDLAGWPRAEEIGAPLVSLCRGAVKDIVRLPRYGWIGKLASLAIVNAALVKLLTKMQQNTVPLDFVAFNKFHHGGKVRQQDIQVMQNCIIEGQARGQPMKKLRELVRRYEIHCGVAPASS